MRTTLLGLALLLPVAGGEEGQPREGLDRGAVLELLTEYLTTSSRKDRGRIEEEFLALEEQELLDGQGLQELLANPTLAPPDPSIFELRGKQGPPDISWSSRRVQVEDPGEKAPDLYTVNRPPGYDPDADRSYPVVLDLGYGVGSMLVSGAGEDACLVAFLHEDAIPEQGMVGSRQGQSLVLSVLADLPRRFRVDQDRVFLTGGGRTGNAVFYLAAHHPHLLAGVIPSSGRLPEFRAFERNVLHLGWLIASRRPGRGTGPIYDFGFDTFERLREQGAKAHFRILDTDTDPRTIQSAARTFIREVARNPWPAELTYRMDDDDHADHYWIHIDKVRVPGRPKVVKILGEHGEITDTRTINSNMAEVEARCLDRRRIEISSDNVKHLTVLLSPQLVDWEKEVTIVANGKEHFSEVPRESLRLMLQRFRASRDLAALPWMRVQLLDL